MFGCDVLIRPHYRVFPGSIEIVAMSAIVLLAFFMASASDNLIIFANASGVCFGGAKIFTDLANDVFEFFVN